MGQKTTYETQTVDIQEDWELARAYLHSRSGELANKVVEWRIADAPSLVLRITTNKVVWYIRGNKKTLRIGTIAEVNVETAKYYAFQVAAAAKRKRNLPMFLNVLMGYENGAPRPPDPYRYDDMIPPDFGPTRNPKFEAGADAFSDPSSIWAYRAAIDDDGQVWKWKTLTHKWLEEKLPQLKPRYRKQYESYLTLKEFEILNDKRVNEIKLRDLERLRDTIHLNHSPSTVHRALTQSKTMLSWAWQHEATKSGLEEVQAEWWKRWSFKYSTKERTHAPTISEIARTLVLAETFRNLGEGEHETYPGTIGALWGVALTGQRTGALLRLRVDRLYDGSAVAQKLPKCRDLTDWEIANWTSDEMKGGKDGGRPHSLPLTPKAVAILNSYHREAGGDSEWMFPAKGPKKAVTPSALNQLMYRLQGRVYDHTVKQKPQRQGKPGPKPKPKKLRRDLFREYDIQPWTLHDVRRTLTTFLDDMGMGGAATAILGHKTSASHVEERERMAPVTQQHYNRSQKINLKAEGMALWVDALMAAYEEEKTFVLGKRI